MNPRRNLQTRKHRRKRQITWWFSPRAEPTRRRAIDKFLGKKLMRFVSKNIHAIASQWRVNAE